MKIKMLAGAIALVASAVTVSAQGRPEPDLDIVELKQALMQMERRVKELEEKTQDIRRGMSDDGRVPYLVINARLGLMSDFWARKPIYQGAMFSIGNAIDPFGMYLEMETLNGFAPSLGGRRSGIYVATLGTNRPGEEVQNIGIEAHAANSQYGNIPYYGDYTLADNSLFKGEGLRLVEMGGGARQQTISFSADWINLLDGQKTINQFGIQKQGAGINILWRR